MPPPAPKPAAEPATGAAATALAARTHQAVAFAAEVEAEGGEAVGRWAERRRLWAVQEYISHVRYCSHGQPQRSAARPAEVGVCGT
eukprot:SAG11_NODE_3126_length_2667_cov_4.469237_1_plen_86_part_00